MLAELFGSVFYFCINWDVTRPFISTVLETSRGLVL